MRTAMQWLKEQYVDRGETIPLGVFQEALEKEKEQIIQANAFGRNKLSPDFKYISSNGTITKLGKIYGEDYYNEQFNKEQILNQNK